MVWNKFKKYVRKGWKNIKKDPVGAYGLATKAFTLAKTLATVINAEKKYADTAYTGTNCSNAYTPTSVTAIVQGATANQRNGNSIKLVSLNMKGYIAQSANFNAMARVMLVRDKFNQGTIPAIADILQNTASTQTVVSPLNIDNAGRFQVMYDRLFTMTNTGQSQVFFKKYFKLNHHARYNGAAATDEKQGQIFVLFITEQTASVPLATVNFRVGFYDN